MRKLSIALVLAVAFVSGGVSWAQNSGDHPPHIERVDLQIAHFIGSRAFGVDLLFQFGVWLGVYQNFGTIYWQTPVPFNPATDVASEFDILLGDLVVTDVDLALDPNQTQQQAQQFFYRFQTFSSLGPPPAPPLETSLFSNNFEVPYQVIIEPPPSITVHMLFTLGIPTLLGPNQFRLRGLQDWDAYWEIHVAAANSDAPDPAQMDQTLFFLFAKLNERLTPPNGPPFADAGTDQTVAINTTVTLDARETFDSSNIGFDPNDVNVFAKDRLSYSWEWVSGPDRIDPQPVPGEPANSPLARVTVDMLTPPNNPYVYRVSVQDMTNQIPSSATVQITVVSSLPINYTPRAIVTAPTDPVPVGSQVTLNGAGSFDPGGATLSYKWSQTNELGTPLQPDELAAQFQPLNGASTATATWIPTKAGIYYFLLLVTNSGGLSASARTSVEVVDTSAFTSTGTSSSSNTGTSSGTGTQPSDGSQTNTTSTTPGACGAGLVPVGLVPFALLLMRRRHP